MGKVAFVLLFVCLGASCIASEGQRTHVNFAARTYYTSNETEVEAENTTTNIPDRYPHGYPNAEHQYDANTGEHASNETVNVSEGRYVHGYYNESWTKYSETDTIPVVKSTVSTYTTVDKDAAGVPNRYETGYPRVIPSYTGATTGLAKTTDLLHRYEHGYYGHASQYLKGTAHESVSYTTETTKPDVGVPQERYPHGYYENSQYAGNPNYGTTKSTPQFSSSYSENFNTMPYPNVGVPYFPAGAGCRTAYWAKDVAKWPAFFTEESTLGDAFGVKATEVYGGVTILQSLLKYSSDPYSELARAASTALLNSYERGAYPLSHMKVIEKFNAALISKNAATEQALEFEKFNVDSISQGNACS